MIVECQNCRARFRLDSSQIKVGGLRIRCPKCNHLFFVEKTEEQSLSLRRKQTPNPKVRRRQKIAAWAISFLCTVLAIGIGYSVFLAGKDFNVSQHIKSWVYRQSDPGNKKITLSDVNGFFERNNEIGRIFVVRGMATNDYSNTRSFIKIKGMLLDSQGRSVVEKAVICGNIVSDEKLNTLTPEEIDGELSGRDSAALSVTNVKPHQSAPFMVAFYNPPKHLTEFAIEVVSSQPQVGAGR